MVSEGVVKELSVITSCDVTLPVAVGAKCTSTVPVLLAAIVAGREPSPSAVKTLLLGVSAETVTALELEFVSVILLVDGLPMATDPNDTVLVEEVKLPALPPDVPVFTFGFAVIPPQPERTMLLPRATNPKSKDES